MTDQSKKYLSDILLAIDLIDDFTNSIIWAIIKRHLTPLNAEVNQKLGL